MKRRQFLKILSAAPVVAAAPALAKTDKEMVFDGVDSYLNPNWLEALKYDAAKREPVTASELSMMNQPTIGETMTATEVDKRQRELFKQISEARDTLNNQPVPKDWLK